MSDLTEKLEAIIADHVYAVTAPGDAWVEGIPDAAASIVDELGLDQPGET